MVGFMFVRAILSLIPRCLRIWSNSTSETEAGAERSRQVSQIRFTQNAVEREASLLKRVEELMAELFVERLKNDNLMTEMRQERQRRISQENTDRIQRRHIYVLQQRELQWQKVMREAREELAAYETPSLDISPTRLTSAENITTGTKDQNNIFMSTVLQRCEPGIRLSHCHDPVLKHPEHVVVDGENVVLFGGKSNEDNILSLADHYIMKKQYPLVVLKHFRVNKKNKDDKWGIAEKLSSSLNGNWQVIPVPINADDDMYAINLAKNLDAIIVSNDHFRKEIGKQETPKKQKELAEFVGEKRVAFTFKKGKYHPLRKQQPYPRCVLKEDLFRVKAGQEFVSL